MAIIQGGRRVELIDGAQLDAFGRLRVSQPELLMSSTAVHDTRSDLFDQTIVGAGTVVATRTGSIALNVTTANGDAVRRRGHTLHIYRSGQAHRATLSFVLPAAKANQEVEIGFYDGPNTTIGGASVWGNGVLLRRQGTGPVTLRVVNLDAGPAVDQSDWNVDPMDGTGRSGITIDWTKAQILAIDLQALYVGRVRVGFYCADGLLRIVHEFQHANTTTAPYISSANLAPWYSIRNTGVVASPSTLLQICAEVSRDGGPEDLTEIVTVENPPITGSIALATTLVSCLSFRLWHAFPSAALRVAGITLLNRSNVSMGWYLLKNPTLAGALTWGGAPFTGTRMIEVSTTLQTVSARGTTLGAGFITAGAAAARGGITLPPSVDRDLCSFGLNGVSDIYVLAALAATGSNQDFNCALDIAEIE